MNQVAFILDNTTLYWYSIVLALAVTAGICFFMACCSHSGVRLPWAAASVLPAVFLSLVLSRLVFWYCRADSFRSLGQALTTPSSGSLALAGAFLGCGLAALVLGRFAGGTLKLLDCMSVAGSCAICLGRLGNFFTSADRGQILTEMTFLPWSYPVVNATSGELDTAVEALGKVFQKMLKLAQIEKSAQLMAEEIEKTRRRVNALEYVMIPNTQEAIRYITMKLDENDRSTTTRLMKVKDMLLKEAIEEQRARSEEAMARYAEREC